MYSWLFHQLQGENVDCCFYNLEFLAKPKVLLAYEKLLHRCGGRFLFCLKTCANLRL